MDINELKKHLLRLIVENDRLKRQIRYDLKTAISRTEKAVKEIE